MLQISTAITGIPLSYFSSIFFHYYVWMEWITVNIDEIVDYKDTFLYIDAFQLIGL